MAFTWSLYWVVQAVEHGPAVHLDPESGRAKLVLNPQPLSPRKVLGVFF